MESSMPKHGRTILGDNFNEDETELQFLRSKPTCFVVLGKPGCGKTTLSQRLAQLWRCELVHGTEMIQNEMEMSTEVGKKMQEMLLKGEALSSEFVIQLIREKILSPEVQHHGYVLDGIPCQDENIMSIQEQIDMVKGWKLKPDFIINIKIPDMDLNDRRVGLRVDPITGDIFCREQWDPEIAPKTARSPTGEEEEGELLDEEEDELMGEREDEVVAEFFEVDKETKERLVRIPENLPEFVTQSTETFKDLALKPLEEYMGDHDQQYLIELDANLSPNTLFQQLVTKLDSYVLRRAAVPMRLQNPDEEELPDEIETEELLRTLAAYQMPAPRYRWRRSKWGRICPVALKEGNILQGKPDLAVSFLDKMYIMSSPEAMTKFLKNPRPYLLPPLPKAPCKISVLGFPVSGKSSLCKVLAERYEATVLDVNELMKKKFAEARKELVDKAKQDATESAVNLVQNKLEQEATERAEARKKEDAERLAALAAENEGEAETAEEGEEKEESEEPPSGEEAPITTEESAEETTTSDAREASPVPTVTEDHPEVQKIIAEAVAKAEKEEIKLPAETYVTVLKETVDAIVAERLEADPDAARDGGWILDNFPTSKEQWGAMAEASFLPDEVICLTDKSPNNELLRLRYHEQNNEEITEKYRKRLIREKMKLLEEEEEIHLQREALEKEEAEGKSMGGTTTDEGGTQGEEDGEGDEKTVTSQADTIKTESSIRIKLHQEIEELKTNYIGIPTADAPEFADFRDSLQNFEKEWATLQNSIGGVASTRPLVVNVQDKSLEDISVEARERIENPFGYRAQDFSGMDIDEEEADNLADDEGSGEGEEEGEEDEEALRHKKKHFGFSKHYDIVALKDDFVLWPGTPDIAAKYREKIYYFKSPENRVRFVTKPADFLPTTEPLKPPPSRILILGAKGSGKTLHGRWLAQKLGIFHISFRERLQELILPKTGRKLGPEHEEDHLLNKEFSVTVDEAVKKALEGDPETEPPAEEEEKFDWNDEQEAIKANLVDDDALPPEILEKIVPQWWREEPYKSTGFILEGFPRTAEESQFLAQSGLFPDAAVLLMVEDADVVDRLLPPRMEKWIKRRDHKNDKKNKIRETKTKIRNDKIDARRKELLHEREEARAARAAERAEKDEEEEDADDEDQEEEDDIEEILAQEFEEEEEGEEEEEEQEEDARDRMKSEFGEKFDDDTGKLQSVQEQLGESLIPCIEVQASKKPRIVRYLLDQKMKSLVDNRDSLFEKVFPISYDLASKMLLTGFKHPSSFGRWDPVKLKESNEVIQPSTTPTNPLFPVIYQHHIYFLSTLDSRNKFMEQPLSYVLHQPPAKPVVPIRLAVLGPPKSGKTTLANRFAKECGAIRISAGEAIRQVLARQPKSSLAIHINSHLYKGAVVPDALTAEAVATILLDTTCSTRGYVLDGYPCTRQQVELLQKKCIVPVRIIEIKIEGSEVIKRAANDRFSADRTLPLHDSDEAFVIKLAAHEEHIGDVRDWYKTQHQNWVEMDGKLSKWMLWEVALKDTKYSIKQIQDYLDRIARGEAARLNDLCITPTEFKARLSRYGEYCLVSLNKRGELVDCSTNPTLELAAEFRSRYYKLGSKKDLDEFLMNPEQYVPPLATRELPSPELLPKRRTRAEVKAMFPKQVELKAYCPVSFLDGKQRYEALVEGNPELVVEYRGRLYVIETEAKLEKFMRLPEKYCDLKLPHKLPPKKQPMELTSLPMLGYLEQGAANSIIKSLTAVGCFKPKFPFISVTRSCLLFVAYHLKAYNPKASPYVRRKYKQKLENFQRNCELITYLGSNMTKRYRDPTERPIDFDHKMGRFLSLQAAPPIEGWAK